METSFTSVGVFALLGLGLVFGLKHATEVDHVVAVSTIVSEQRNVWRSALVGGLWGAGHTASLVVVGLFVLVFRVAIPMRVANWLEFGVALMIVGLGVLAMTRVLRRRSAIYVHRHLHRHGPDGPAHVHIHFHEGMTSELDGDESSRLSRASQATEASHSHTISRLSLKPFFVGAMHGLAGSTALTLLVLTQIQSVTLGLLYLGVFGIGSALGMVIMSGLIGLPFALSGQRLTQFNYGMQTLAASLSIAFGLWYAYLVGIK
jgi:hypothetical protein